MEKETLEAMLRNKLGPVQNTVTMIERWIVADNTSGIMINSDVHTKLTLEKNYFY